MEEASAYNQGLDGGSTTSAQIEALWRELVRGTRRSWSVSLAYHRESECARASARDWLVRESERALAC